jgi:TolA-binding protein
VQAVLSYLPFQGDQKMKRVTALALVLTLMGVVPAQAQTSTTGKSAKKSAAASNSAIAQQLSELKQALDAQQQQIKQLSDQIQSRDQQIQQLQQTLQQSQTATTQAQSKADEAASQSAKQDEAVNALASDVKDLKQNSTNTALALQEAQKETGKRAGEIKALSKLKLTGDLRLRYEPFFGGGATTAPVPPSRQRERYRLRFNVNTKIDEDFAAGLSLASGDPGDPISTNSTLTGFYTRKPVAIDKAFGVYNPHYFKPFTLTAGKFAYTWLRTELTWDNDLNPEGGSAALAWDWKDKILSHFALVGYGTTVFEVSGGADSLMAGGQLQTGWTLLPRLKLTADAGYYSFDNADTIAQNQGQVPGNGPSTGGIVNTGGGNFGFGGSSLTNNFGVINNKRIFASQFGIVDAIARLDFDTGSKRWPIYALFDFAQNTRACANVNRFIAAGVAPPTCDKHQRHGYWSEFKVGQTKNKGDLMLGYTFARIERDAVLAAFNFSDLRQPTNVIEHRVEAYYQAYPHVQIGWTGLFGRQIVTAQSPTLERFLKRHQLDTIFTF